MHWVHASPLQITVEEAKESWLTLHFQEMGGLLGFNPVSKIAAKYKDFIQCEQDRACRREFSNFPLALQPAVPFEPVTQ